MGVDDVLRAYGRDVRAQMGMDFGITEESISQDYLDFKKDSIPALSAYEKWASVLGGFFKIKVSVKDEANLRKDLDRAHLNVSPSEVFGLTLMSFFLLMICGIIFCFAYWFIVNGDFPYLLLFLIFIASFFLGYYAYSMPQRLAVRWKLKASSQMVPAILYTVIYMKHTSNLERAISFVSKHVEAPLSADFKKVLWDVENGRFSSIKQSLDNYLEFWKETNPEFVESFHLIESSLYEPSETRRIQILERALKVILDEVYEKMLKYSHGIKAPLTNIYMLGIVLPTLGLVLLPLASTLLGGMIKSTHVFVLFNIVIPFFVFYMTMQVMINRPGGYGETSYLEKNPMYPKYNSKKPYAIAFLVIIPFLILGFLPFIMQWDYLTYNVHAMNAGINDNQALLGLKSDYTLEELGISFMGGKANNYFFGFLTDDKGQITGGPFGVGALLLSLFIPFAIALFFALSYFLRTKELIKSRESTKKLEGEFNSSLFTLGNRIGDGIPAEIAFSKVADSLKGQVTEEFFRIVNSNMQTMGMSLDDSIFDQSRGAILYFPSNLIATSMRILIESVKKGLNVAAQSLMSISDYVRNIQKINERLRDLLAEVVSDMQSNMTFLAPLLAGIIIGLAAIITTILGNLKSIIEVGGADTLVGGLSSMSQIANLFNIETMIPTYYMQIAIGIYIIQIVFILTGTLVTIDSGEDKLKQTNQISKNLIKGGLLYLIVAFISIIALSTLAGVALGSLITG